MTNPYPLLFEPVLMPKVWGGDRLARFGKPISPDANIGESWEVADMGSTSASGAGGGGVRSVIANGELKGRTLHDAMAAWGPALLGNAKPSEDGGFPLLVKFLDARENLSVQVHPSPAYATSHPQAKLKTECWYILAADAGSVIYKGVKPGVTRESFAKHIQDGTVVSDLVSIPAVVGECHNLPSGTVHALGAGVLVAEVQTPSDTTYRVFDWGRQGRELHIRESLECIDFGPAPAPVNMDRGGVLTTEFFQVRCVQLAPGESVDLRHGPRCVVVMMLEGSARIEPLEGEVLDVALGRTALIPAHIAHRAKLKAATKAKALIAIV